MRGGAVWVLWCAAPLASPLAVRPRAPATAWLASRGVHLRGSRLPTLMAAAPPEDEERGEEDAEQDGGIKDDARRYLGLGSDDEDLVSYLEAGRDLLGRKVSILLHDEDDEMLSECMLLAATKLVKLGASVEVVTNASGSSGGAVPALSVPVPYPRCVARPVNLTSIGEIAGALRGSTALVLSAADLPTESCEAIVDALNVVSASSGAEGEGAGGVRQIVLLSSVAVYGDETLYTPRCDDDAGCGVDEGGAADGAADAAEAGGGACAAVPISESRELRPESPAASAMLSVERALNVSGARAKLSVLRSCPLYAEEGAAAGEGEAMLSDALGIQELLEEYLDDLHAFVGVAPSATASAASDAISALLPPASTPVQFTHALDLAGAAVYCVIAGLDGAYHVCCAPSTLQLFFREVTERRGWDAVKLRDGGDDAPSCFYSTARLVGAGYSLLRPELIQHGATGATDGGGARAAESERQGPADEAAGPEQSSTTRRPEEPRRRAEGEDGDSRPRN